MATPAPAAPIRKKRNFKALQLDVTKAPTPPPETQPAATRAAPAPAPAARGKKRPPPMQLAAPKVPSVNNAAAETEGAVLSVAGPNSAPATGVPSASKANYSYHSTLSSTLANLEIHSEKSYRDLRNEDLKDLQELGQGNGGSVKKVEHTPTGTIMAKKVRRYSCSSERKITQLVQTRSFSSTQSPL
jgi:mitogen-activated protein kinase kinase